MENKWRFLKKLKISVVDHLPTMHKVLGSTLSNAKDKQIN
jgi:hypothetical protein